MKARHVLALVGILAAVETAQALSPREVFLVVNRQAKESRELAEYYCKKRDVPTENIVELDLPTGEDIGRDLYEQKLAGPLREKLRDRQDRVKVLLTFRGVPLRVGRTQPGETEQQELKKVEEELKKATQVGKDLDGKIKALEEKLKKEKDEATDRDLADARKQRKEASDQETKLQIRRRWLSHQESVAAVDSELSLLWQASPEARRWQLNWLYYQVPEEVRAGKQRLVMTARLDGPDPGLIRRLIDQAVAVEAKGLEGKVYVDARGIRFNPRGDTGTGYGGYDESLREMARLLEKEAGLPVVLDDKGPLFPVGSCTDCALYCGWYSHANFVDCCRFVPGAVAYHIASSEARSLRLPGVKYWCKNLLEKGAVATLGPVAEPYTIGFPKPAEFFGLLVTGEYTLVECYWKTQLLTSWMAVLVGDPLYNPYRKAPRLTPEHVKPSPKGGEVRFRRGG